MKANKETQTLRSATMFCFFPFCLPVNATFVALPVRL